MIAPPPPKQHSQSSSLTIPILGISDHVVLLWPDTELTALLSLIQRQACTIGLRAASTYDCAIAGILAHFIVVSCSLPRCLLFYGVDVDTRL
jgi:hypothetical protein